MRGPRALPAVGYSGNVTSATLANPFFYLQRNADANPNGVFMASPERTLTNAEALVEVKKLAFELRRLGVKPGDVVALDLPDQLSILFTEAVFHEAAISTVVPDDAVTDGVMTVDWMFTSRASVRDRGARVVTVDGRFLREVDQNPSGIEPSDAPMDTLRIAFSSGTTGTPHAIALARAMELSLDAALETWFRGGPSLVLMDTGTAWGLGEFFLSVKGGQPYLSVGGARPEAIVRLASQASVRTIKGSPAQIAAVVAELEAQQRTLPSVETVVVAGTVMPPGVAERTRAATEGCAIFGNYGSTEAGGATARLYESDDPFDAGHPIPGSIVEIVDENDEPVPQGTVGRIRHRSFGMVHEYLGDPEGTARAFRDGWFYPGDLGFIRPDGGLTLTGRETEVLNAGGVKIDPARIDHAALRVPGVREACSFEYAAENGNRQIGLAVVANDLDARALVAELDAEFGAAAPKLIAKVDAIPRTAAGKPKRRELSARFAGS